MRVVLDTNIFISALINQLGSSHFLYELWKNGYFHLLTCEEQLDEFREATRYPKVRQYIQPIMAGAMLNEIKLLSIFITNLPKLRISPDPWDNYILAVALKGKANFIVTGDKSGLLEIKKFKQIKIVNPSQMMRLIGH
ncbi:MAG: putative toxin-antitoxin system toxin component, PIN family [Elusimicrobiota bacterium]